MMKKKCLRTLEHVAILLATNYKFPKLTEQQKLVLVYRYGLNGNNIHTLQEIAQVLSVSPERIRQIIAMSLRKIGLNYFQYHGTRIRAKSHF
jgi:DNA-directed RNA polymerase sigma subunit (sigma70/sigma32)